MLFVIVARLREVGLVGLVSMYSVTISARCFGVK